MVSMPRIDSVGLSLADLDAASTSPAGQRASPVPPARLSLEELFARKATTVGSPATPDASAAGSPAPDLRPIPPAAAPVEAPAAAPAPAPAAEAAAPSKRLNFVEAAARRAVDATRAAGAAGVAELGGNGGACGFAVGARVEVDYDDEGWFGGVVQVGNIRDAYGMHAATGGMHRLQAGCMRLQACVHTVAGARCAGRGPHVRGAA